MCITETAAAFIEEHWSRKDSLADISRLDWMRRRLRFCQHSIRRKELIAHIRDIVQPKLEAQGLQPPSRRPAAEKRKKRRMTPLRKRRPFYHCRVAGANR